MLGVDCPHEEQLSPGNANQGLRDREQAIEASIGRGRDENASLDRRFGEAEGRALSQDRALELPQRRARFDSELLDESLPRPAVRFERLGLAA